MKKYLFGILWFLAPCAFGAAGHGEVADTLTAALGEVTVTAVKESAARVSAITRIGAEETDRLQIMTMKGVSELAPNFYIPDYGSRMTSSVYMRGIGARIDQPSVGLCVDNVPFLNKDNYDFDLTDIESIEVLRGPQNTLYGRNTMAGMVTIQTLSPLRYQGVRLMAEGGTGNLWRGSAGVYAKPLNNLGMSLVANVNYLGGYFRNVRSGEHADKEKGGSLRWKTMWRPAGQWAVDNTAALMLNRQDGYPYRLAETGKINYGDTCFYKRTGVTDGLAVRYVGDKVSITSMTSFQYLKDNMTLDQDFLPLDYFTLTQARHEWSVTEDIVARGSVGNYNWLGGVFGFLRRTNMHAPVIFKEDGIAQLIVGKRNDMNPLYPVEWDSDNFALLSDFVSRNEAVALYHRSELKLGKWTVGVDLRLDVERARLYYTSKCDDGYTIWDMTGNRPHILRHENLVLDRTGNLRKTFTQLMPKISSVWIPLTNLSLYANIAKGYKAGGYNTQMFSDVLQQAVMEEMGLTAKYDVNQIVAYKPEKSWNYEVGTQWQPTQSVNIEGAVFYIDCRDQQLTTFPDGTTTGRIMTNAGKTRSWGAELSVRWRALQWLALNGAWGFTHATFLEYNNGIQDFSGKRVPYVPANTLFLQAVANHPVGRGMTLEGSLDMRGVGDIWWDEENTQQQPFYVQLGASVTLSAPRWSVALWGENITGTRFDTFSYKSIGNTFLQQGKPARMGVTMRINLPN